jgi:hypothetical protein
MLEFIGVFLALVFRWAESSKTKIGRKYGFLGSAIVGIYWVGFFLCSKLHWLALYSTIRLVLSMNGFKNNHSAEKTP